MTNRNILLPYVLENLFSIKIKRDFPEDMVNDGERIVGYSIKRYGGRGQSLRIKKDYRVDTRKRTRRMLRGEGY
jgi:hypothetical protein